MIEGRFTLRHGTTIPTTNDLLENELGVYTDQEESGVYININDSIKNITPIIFYTTINLEINSTLVTISNNKLYEDAIIFIDLNYAENPSKEQIKAFRKADLVQSSFNSDSSTLTLAVNGTIPVASTNVPIKVVVL